MLEKGMPYSCPVAEDAIRRTAGIETTRTNIETRLRNYRVAGSDGFIIKKVKMNTHEKDPGKCIPGGAPV